MLRCFFLFCLIALMMACGSKSSTTSTDQPSANLRKVQATLVDGAFFKGKLDNQHEVGFWINSVSNYNGKTTIYVSYFYAATHKMIRLEGSIQADSTLFFKEPSAEKGETWQLAMMDDGSLRGTWQKPAENKKMEALLQATNAGEATDFQAYSSRFLAMKTPFATQLVMKKTKKVDSGWQFTEELLPDDFLVMSGFAQGIIAEQTGKKFGVYDETNGFDTKAHYGYRLDLPNGNIGLIISRLGNNESFSIELLVYDKSGKLLQNNTLDNFYSSYGIRIADISLSNDFTFTLDGMQEVQGREDVTLEDGSETNATVIQDELAPFKVLMKLDGNLLKEQK